MTNERASELWSMWVGSQTPADFAAAIAERGKNLRAAVKSYVREQNARVPGWEKSSADECAEAVEAILYLIVRPEFRAAVLEDLTDPRD